MKSFIRWPCVIAILFFGSSGTAPTSPNSTSVSSNSSDQSVDEPKVEAYRRLREKLVRGRSPELIIPPKYFYPISKIMLAFDPLQIIVFDEVLQSISIASAITLIWKDITFGWNPKDFADINSIKLPSSLLWVPTIFISQTAVSEETLVIPEYLEVSSTGMVSAFIPTLTITLCNLDLANFPFDEQNCTLTFLEADFYNMSSNSATFGDISQYFGTNAAWVLAEHGCYQHVTSESNLSFQYINCYVFISRRSAFYMINLIGPMALTSLMTLLVFCVPVDGGEKISFIVSIFLSTSVYYDFIIDMTPRSIESLPRVNWLIVGMVLSITGATAATTYVLIRHSKLQRLKQRKHLRNLQIGTGLGQSPAERKDAKIEGEVKSAPSVLSFGSVASLNTPTSSEYDGGQPLDDNKAGRSCWSRQLTHTDMDNIFFALMSSLTVLVYLCTFLIPE